MNPIGIDDTDQLQRLCEALEITGLDELHPNCAELLTRKILPLDGESLGMLVGAINQAKARSKLSDRYPATLEDD